MTSLCSLISRQLAGRKTKTFPVLACVPLTFDSPRSSFFSLDISFSLFLSLSSTMCLAGTLYIESISCTLSIYTSLCETFSSFLSFFIYLSSPLSFCLSSNKWISFFFSKLDDRIASRLFSSFLSPNHPDSFHATS